MKTVFIASDQQLTLAQEIAHRAGLHLIQVATRFFPDGQMQLTSDGIGSIKNAHVIIVHATTDPIHTNIMWILFVLQMLQSRGAHKISLMMPYCAYARQTVYVDGSPGPFYAIVAMLQKMGIAALVTVELHDPTIITELSLPVHNITLEQYIADFIQTTYSEKQVTIVAPDEGALERAASIAQQLHAPLLVCKKKRDSANNVHIVSLNGSCQTDYALIVDDIIDTGSTILAVAHNVRLHHKQCKIDVFGVHGVLSNNAIDRLEQTVINRIWVTNTIQQAVRQVEKIEVIDIVPYLAKQLQKIFNY